jgi:hypothetical protein
VQHDRGPEPEQDPGVGVGLGQDERQVRRLVQDRREGVRRPGLHHGTVHHVADRVDRDVVHQQRGDDLVHAAGDPQVGRQEGPQPASDAAGQERERDVDRGRQPRHVEAHPGCAQAAQVDLPLGADVEEADPRSQGDAESGEEDRRHLGERGAEAKDVTEGAVRDRPVGGPGVPAGEADEGGADPERHAERPHRDQPEDEPAPAARHARPPVISIPT